MGKPKLCTDPTHKPHDGLAAQNARLLTALQWALNNIDPMAEVAYTEEFVKHYELAWGIKPKVKMIKEDDDELS